MALPNLTAINIYLADNTLWRTIELAGDCKYIDELEGDERVELKWESYDYEKIPVGSYVIYDNRVFRLTEPHEPSRRMENVFTYSPTFYTESYHWRKAMACYYEYSGEVTYTNSDNTISANIPEPTSRELDWSFTGNLPDALFMLLQAIKNETGSVWKAHYDSSVANQLIEITAQGLSVRDMLTQIADQCGKEFYFDYSGATPVVNIGTLELTASGEHTEDGRIVLNIGEDVGNPTVNSEAEEYFTRFYFFGSTRNIEQPTSVTKSSVVNRRLPLLSSASGNNNYYPKGFIDISGGSYVNHAYTPSLPDYKVFAKSVFFDDIYPHASYKVLSVQKAYIPVKDDANQPTGERMPIYYVALYDSNDANRQAIAFNDWVGEKNGVEGQMVPTLVPSIAFRGGYLQGLEYELIYHRAGDKVSTYAADGTKSQLTLTANCFEIVFDTNANPRLPNDTIFPRGYTAGTYDGDDCTLFNIKMPASYILNAQLELETKALQYIADLNVDKSSYEMVSDADNFERVIAFKELRLGNKVKMIYPQIMGRNLIQTQLLSYSTNRGIKGENVGDGWIKLSGTLTTGSYPEIFSIVKNFNEDNTIAAEENYTLSVVDESGILSSNGIRVVARVCVAGSTTLKRNYTVSSTPNTIDMTGGWLARLSLYCEENKSGIEINGRIRIKLEKGAVAHPWTPAPEENGQSVLSRVISIERCLDLPCDCGITLGYSAKQGNIKTLREIIADTSDKTETVIKSGEKNKAQILGLRNGYRAQQEALDTYFDPDGSFDGSRIKPETVQTGALAVGAKSQQFTLSGVQMSVAKYSSGNGTLSWVCDSGKLAHFSLDDEYTLIWPMATGTQALNNANAHYIYAKCAKDGFGAASGGIKTNSNSGTFVATAEQIKFDSDNNYYYFLVGTVSSAQTDSDSTYKTRIISMTYGMTTINGKQITTGVIRSSDSNHGVVINLDTGEIIGKIIFRTSQGTAVNAETYIGETAEAAAQTAVDNLEIGGRNLLAVKNAVITPVLSEGSITKLPDGWFHIEGTITGTAAGLPRPLWGEYTEANTIAKDGIYTLSIETRGTMPISDKYKVQVYSYASGGTSNGSSQYITTPNGKLTIDLTGRWLLRVVMYKTADATGTVVNGDIRFKLEKGNKATDWTPAPEDVNAAIEAEATALETLATTIAGEISDLQKQIDGQIMSFFYNYVPTMQNEPAATWQSQGTENVHLGDLFYDTSTGYAYRFANTGTEAQPVYSWLRITDTDVTKALADAAKAQATADKKMRTFTAQPVPPYDKGDVWLQGALGDILYCGTAKTEGQSYAAADWVTASKYIDQTTAETVAQNAVDALEIGGRNYILAPTTSGTNPTTQIATYTYDNGDYVITKASGSGFSQLRVKNAILKYSELGNKTVTISVKDIVSSNANNEWRIYLYATKSGETDYAKRLFQTTNKETFTFPTFGEGWNCGIILRVAQSGGSVGDTLTVKGLKLEKGSKSTDWTPAPEDTEAELAALQADLQNQIDGKIETWSQVADPSSAWTTTALKDKHINDLWYYTGESTDTRTNNKTYKYTKSGSTYSWAEYSAGGGDLFDRIDGKAAIFYGSPSGTYEDVEEGDFLVDGETGISYKRLNNAWVKVQDYQEAIANIKIGGRNLLVYADASVGSSGGLVTTKLGKDGWFHIEGTINSSSANAFRPLFGSFTEADTVAKNGTVTLSVNTEGTLTIGEQIRIVVVTAELGQTDTTTTYITDGLAHTIDLAGKWLVRINMYRTSDAMGLTVNGNIRFKLEEGNKASTWTPAPEDVDAGISNAQSAAAAAQESANTANTTISNMNNDAVFSKLEKKSFRVEWKNIQGTVTADTTYTNDGSYAKAIAAVNGTTVGHGTLDTAYTNLKNYLIKWKLDINEDTDIPASGSGTFSQGDLGAVTAAYYNAETALYDALADYWSEQQAKMAVDNLVIGGANLLPTLNVWELGTWSSSTGSHTSSTIRIRCTKNNYFIPITASTDYVISQHTLASASKNYQIVIYAYDSSGNFVSADSKTSWQSTFPIKYKSATATRLEIGIRHSDDSAITADEAATARIQIEKGNKATDWKPAAADTEAALTALQTDLQGQIDRKIETYYQTASPSTNWTSAEKTAHTGDLWYYTGEDSGSLKKHSTYRWNGTAWVEQQAPEEIFDKIDGKSAIFYGSPTDTYTGLEEGDFLVDSTTNICYKWNGSSWDKVQDVQVGGKNLLIVKDAKVGTANSIVSTKLTEGWFHLAGTFSYGTYPETRPAFGNFTEADTPAKDGIYTLSIQCDNLTLDGNFRVVVGSYALGSTSGRQDVFLAQSNGSITIDLTGRWLLRVLMHGNPNANGKVINGNIRFKLEKGNRATDWTPTPEDQQEYVDEQRRQIENGTKYITDAIEAARQDEGEIEGGLILGTFIGVRNNGVLAAALNGATTGDEPMIQSGMNVDPTNMPRGTFRVYPDGHLEIHQSESEYISMDDGEILFKTANGTRNRITVAPISSSGLVGAEATITNGGSGSGYLVSSQRTTDPKTMQTLNGWSTYIPYTNGYSTYANVNYNRVSAMLFNSGNLTLQKNGDLSINAFTVQIINVTSSVLVSTTPTGYNFTESKGIGFIHKETAVILRENSSNIKTWVAISVYRNGVNVKTLYSETMGNVSDGTTETISVPAAVIYGAQAGTYTLAIAVELNGGTWDTQFETNPQNPSFNVNTSVITAQTVYKAIIPAIACSYNYTAYENVIYRDAMFLSQKNTDWIGFEPDAKSTKYGSFAAKSSRTDRPLAHLTIGNSSTGNAATTRFSTKGWLQRIGAFDAQSEFYRVNMIMAIINVTYASSTFTATAIYNPTGRSFSATRNSQGHFTLTHNIGHSNYVVFGSGTPSSSSGDHGCYVSFYDKGTTSVKVRVADDSTANDFDCVLLIVDFQKFSY